MYSLSGGCLVMKRCYDCRYLAIDYENEGFGRKGGTVRENYECLKHPDKGSGKNWKKTYTACKYFEEPNLKTIFAEEQDTGQLSFF